jgi:TrmH family RNA methyltransferase
MGGPAAFPERFVVVLQETQDIVNIAGTMRAMMNMGLYRLRLVKPALFDAHRIDGIAHGSKPYLEKVEFFDTLDAALADVLHSVATTARWRSEQFVWQHPRDAAPELLALPATAAKPIALVFGREDSGLFTEEVDRCDRVITIPTNPKHSSLNLAQAVLLVLYELWMAEQGSQHNLPEPRKVKRAPPATTAELNAMFGDMEIALDRIQFFKKRNPAVIMRSVRAAARRASLNQREAKLFRAMAIEVRKILDRLVKT